MASEHFLSLKRYQNYIVLVFSNFGLKPHKLTMHCKRSSNTDRSALIFCLANVDSFVSRHRFLNPKLSVLNAGPAGRHFPVLAMPHQGRGRVAADLANENRVVAGSHRDVVRFADEERFDWKLSIRGLNICKIWKGFLRFLLTVMAFFELLK